MSQSAYADEYEEGIRLWREHDYRHAYEVLSRYREMPYGRNAQVDYMLGTSACRLPELHTWGRDYLQWILRRYALPDNCRLIVEESLQSCQASSSASANEPVTVDQLADVIGATSRLSGKMYYFIGHNEAVNNFAAVRIRPFDPAELRARLVNLEEPIRAVESVKSHLPSKWLGIHTAVKVESIGRFVLVAIASKTDSEMQRMASFLDRYVTFLEREYALALPKKFITIYFVTTPEDIAMLADRLHGLRIGRPVMGYSFRDDLSVLAVVPTGFTVGTVQHELFHLAVRSTFGDIPQWLDEGIASLYEVSRLDPDTMVAPGSQLQPKLERCMGLPNWRWRILHTLKSVRPTIAKMIESDWYAFEQPDRAQTSEFARDYRENPPSAEVMAATLATARYFMLYLQDKGLLKALYSKLQNQKPGFCSDPRNAAMTAVEEVLGKTLAEIDKEFTIWFENQPQPH
jgi:hypothetical protein